MRTRIPRRKPIFLACEGQSERSYAVVVQSLSNSQGVHVAINTALCDPPGGDPLALIKSATTLLTRRHREGHHFKHQALLLDTDRLGQDDHRDAEAYELAARHDLQLIFQDQDHEAFLLRHFPDCQQLHPPHEASMNELLKRYPKYKKNTAAVDLGRNILEEHVRRAATVEHELAKFLEILGWRL